MPTPNKRTARQPAADVDKRAEAAPELTGALTEEALTAAPTATSTAEEPTEPEVPRRPLSL